MLLILSVVVSFHLAYSYYCNEVQFGPNSPPIGCYWQNKVLAKGNLLPLFWGALGSESFSIRPTLVNGQIHVDYVGPAIVALPLAWVAEIASLYIVACLSLRTAFFKPRVATFVLAVLSFSLIYFFSFHEPPNNLVQPSHGGAPPLACSVYFLFNVCGYCSGYSEELKAGKIHVVADWISNFYTVELPRNRGEVVRLLDQELHAAVRQVQPNTLP
jgi:hypothetical protein